MTRPISNKNNLTELQKKAKIKSKEKKTGNGKSVNLKKAIKVQKTHIGAKKKNSLSTQTKLSSYISENIVLFDSAPIAYFILDLNGNVINVNKKGMLLLDVKKNGLIGKNLSTLINSKSYQDKFNIHKDLVIEKDRSQQFECELKKGDGSLFFGLIDSNIIKDEENNFKYFLSVISDISTQKLQERLLEKALKKEIELSRMKSQFVSIASHEFRTPLATILTSTELIEKYNKPEDLEKKVKHFHKIKSSVSRMKEILMDFLSVDEVEKGKITNNPEKFILSDFLKDLIEETKHFNGIHTQKYEHLGNHDMVCLDKKLLKTCVTNLIINAYKYSPSGGAIQITSKQNISGTIEILVIDKGIGIPDEDQEHIFSRFFRAKNAVGTQGTGLGLNITKQLTEIMGGTIYFFSDTKTGTTFTLKFPK